MGRPMGSKDLIPRGSGPRKAFEKRGCDLVEVAAGILKDPDVEPKIKADLLSDLLPYMFSKVAAVRVKENKEGDEPEEDTGLVLTPDEILAKLDASKRN